MALSGRGPSLERTRKLAGLIRELKQRYPIEVCLSAGLIDEEQRAHPGGGGSRSPEPQPQHQRVALRRDLLDPQLRRPRRDARRRPRARPRALQRPHRGHGRDESRPGGGRPSQLRELEVPSIPVNFLIPIDGNPVRLRRLADARALPARAGLMRLINPRAEIRVAGGREGHLRALEALALWPANSLFVEGYLTTRGDAVDDTYRMIRDAGFEIEGNALLREARRERREGGRRRLPPRRGGDRILKPDMARGDVSAGERRATSPTRSLDAIRDARHLPPHARARRRPGAAHARRRPRGAALRRQQLPRPRPPPRGRRGRRARGPRLRLRGRRLAPHHRQPRRPRGARGGAREVPRQPRPRSCSTPATWPTSA